MAKPKGKGPKMATSVKERATDRTTNQSTHLKPVRLDLEARDHARLAKVARRRGLAMASFVRMKLLEWLEEEERR